MDNTGVHRALGKVLLVAEGALPYLGIPQAADSGFISNKTMEIAEDLVSDSVKVVEVEQGNLGVNALHVGGGDALKAVARTTLGQAPNGVVVRFLGRSVGGSGFGSGCPTRDA